MPGGSSSDLRRQLVLHLRRRGYLTDPAIARAFLEVPREVFLPDHAARLGIASVYRDEAIVIRRDPADGAPRSSSSQPAIMALMLQMLAVTRGDRVLEIGAGTGYNAALLGLLTGPQGQVITVDVDIGLARRAAAALGQVGSAARVVVADGRAGFPGSALFDRMEVTASFARVPQAWHHQLAPGGRLVMPLRLGPAADGIQAIAGFVKTSGGFDSVAVTAGSFLPLRPPVHQPTPGQEQVTTGSGQEGRRSAPGPLSLALGREAIGNVTIKIRYTEDPPASRWCLRRGGHWIGVDLPENVEVDVSGN